MNRQLKSACFLVGATALALAFSPSEAQAAARDTYEVSKGDTLYEIGQELGLPWRDIAKANSIEDPWIIYPHQDLRLPVIPGSGADKVAKIDGLEDASAKLASRLYGLDKNTDREVRRTAAFLGPMFGIEHVGGYAQSGHSYKSDHYLGLALDMGVGTIKHGHKTGEELAAYAKKHYEELNIKYIIWDRHIWSPERADEGWRPYHGASDHTDHVHLSFYADDHYDN